MITTGYICAVLSAICYGLNPLGALFLYDYGLTTATVLFYRFLFASAVLALILKLGKISFGVTKKELLSLAALGLMFTSSGYTLFASFNYIAAGTASTILFIYPIFVALIMAIFFKERIYPSMVVAFFLALAGIFMLYRGEDGMHLNGVGLTFVLVSALSYALYIVFLNKFQLAMSSKKVAFYVTAFCCVFVFLISVFSQSRIQPIPHWKAWIWIGELSLITAILAMVLLSVAVRFIGSTPTSILGALEPLTAVLVGILIFGEKFTFNHGVGIVLIVGGVLLVVIVGGKKKNENIGH